jgi:hypothetical protein
MLTSLLIVAATSSCNSDLPPQLHMYSVFTSPHLHPSGIKINQIILKKIGSYLAENAASTMLNLGRKKRNKAAVFLRNYGPSCCHSTKDSHSYSLIYHRRLCRLQSKYCQRSLTQTVHCRHMKHTNPLIIIIISNLSYDRSTASSKTIPPLSAI